MRISYIDGKLFLSLTRDEVKLVSDNVGSPVELPIEQLNVLKDDVHQAYTSYWSKIIVPLLIREHQRSQNSTPKKRK